MEDAKETERIRKLIREVQDANQHRLNAESEMLEQDEANEGLVAALVNIRDKHQGAGNAKTVALIDAVLLLCEANARLRYDMWEKLSNLSQVQMDRMNLTMHEKQHIYLEANLDVNESKIFNQVKRRAFAPQRPYIVKSTSNEAIGVRRGGESFGSQASVWSKISEKRNGGRDSATFSSLMESTNLSFHSMTESFSRRTSDTKALRPLPTHLSVVRHGLETIKKQLPVEAMNSEGRRSVKNMLTLIQKNTTLLASHTDQLVFVVFLESSPQPPRAPDKDAATPCSQPALPTPVSLAATPRRSQHPNKFGGGGSGTAVAAAAAGGGAGAGGGGVASAEEGMPPPEREGMSSLNSPRVVKQPADQERCIIKVKQGKVVLDTAEVEDGAATINILEARINPRYPLEIQVWKTNEEFFSEVDGRLRLTSLRTRTRSSSGDSLDVAVNCLKFLDQGLDYVGSAQVFVSQLHVTALSTIGLRLDLMEMCDVVAKGVDRRVLRYPLSMALPQGWHEQITRDGIPFYANATGDTCLSLKDIQFFEKITPSEGKDSSSSSSSSSSSLVKCFTVDSDLVWVNTKNMRAVSGESEHMYAVLRDVPKQWYVLNAIGKRIQIHRAENNNNNNNNNCHHGTEKDTNKTPKTTTNNTNNNDAKDNGGVGVDGKKGQKASSSSSSSNSCSGGLPGDVEALEAEYTNNPPLTLKNRAISIQRVITRRRDQNEASNEKDVDFGFFEEWEPAEAKRIRENLLQVPSKSQRVSRICQTHSNAPAAAAAAVSSDKNKDGDKHESVKCRRASISSISFSPSPSSPPSSSMMLSSPPSTYPYDYPDGPFNILFDSKEGRSGTQSVRCATLDKLIERVTHPHIPPANIRTVFLLMYHSFTTPRELLAKLVSRYFMPTPPNVTPEELKTMQKTQQNVRLRVVTLVLHWINAHYTDFQDDSVLFNGMRDFLILIGYKHKVRLLDEGPRELLETKLKMSESVLPSSITAENYNFACTGNQNLDIETARQLSLMCFDEFKKIRMRDVLDKIFEGKDNVHITALVDFFNNMSKLVQHTVVSEPKIKQRAALFSKFTDIAMICREQNNFLISYAISSGLGSAPLYRLRKTKELLPQRTLDKIEQLKELYKKGASAKPYRSALKHAVTNPCVPFIGTTMKDLTFTHDGNKDMVSGMINFYKRALMSESIQQLDQFQRKRYLFQPVDFIQKQLR